jgi:PAS domain S-box-containing protein
MSLFDLPPAITALESSEDALVVVNLEGAVVLMTPAAEKLFGASSEDTVGEFVEMLVPQKMRWGHQAYRRGYQVEARDREMDPGLDPHGIRPDGSEFPVHVRLEPVTVDGDMYVVAHVTER